MCNYPKISLFLGDCFDNLLFLGLFGHSFKNLIKFQFILYFIILYYNDWIRLSTMREFIYAILSKYKISINLKSL